MRRIGAVLIAGLVLAPGFATPAASDPAPPAPLPESVEQVSVGGTADRADVGHMIEPSISDDGRYVAFLADWGPVGSQYAPMFTRRPHVMLRDRQLGTTVGVDVDAAGVPYDGVAGCPVISGDGSTVFFWSNADELAGPLSQIVAYDVATGALSIVSTTLSGVPTAREVYCDISTSRDARYVSFTIGPSSDLVHAQASQGDAVIKDRTSGAVELVDPTAEYWGSSSGALSADGTRIVYERRDGAYSRSRLFVRDRVLGQRTQLFTGDNDRGDAAAITEVAISDNGRYVAFETDSVELLPGVPMQDEGYACCIDVVVHDLLTGLRQVASTGPLGVELAGAVTLEGIDASGTRVAMTLNDQPGEPSNPFAIVKDLRSGAVLDVGFGSWGDPPSPSSDVGFELTPDGRTALFGSLTPVEGDVDPTDELGPHYDIFARTLAPPVGLCGIALPFPLAVVVGVPFQLVGQLVDAAGLPRPATLVNATIDTPLGRVTIPVTTDLAGRFTIPGLVVDAAGIRVSITVDVGPERCELDVAAPAVTATPGPVLDTALVAGNRFVTARWQPPAHPGTTPILGYWLVASQGGRAVAQRWLATDVTSTSVEGLANGQAVSVSVTAVNGAGFGAAVTLPITTPKASGLAPTTAGAPQALTATSVRGGITARWSPPLGDGGAGITGYAAIAVDRTTGRLAAWQNVGPDERTVSLPGLTNGRAYDITALAVSARGFGTVATVTGVVPRLTDPAVTAAAAPGFALAHPIARGAVVTWGPPPADGGAPIVAYVVIAVQHGRVVAGLPVAPAARQLTVPGLARGVEATIHVLAVTAAGFGAGTARAVTPS